MPRIGNILAGVLPLLFVSLFAIHAVADTYPIAVTDAVIGTINFVFAGLVGLVGVVSTFLFNLVKGPAKLKPEHQTYLTVAITSGLLMAQENLSRAARRNIKDPVVENKLIADAANFVLQNVPRLVALMGLDENSLKVLIQKQLTKEG